MDYIDDQYQHQESFGKWNSDLQVHTMGFDGGTPINLPKNSPKAMKWIKKPKLPREHQY